MVFYDQASTFTRFILRNHGRDAAAMDAGIGQLNPRTRENWRAESTSPCKALGELNPNTFCSDVWAYQRKREEMHNDFFYKMSLPFSIFLSWSIHKQKSNSLKSVIQNLEKKMMKYCICYKCIMGTNSWYCCAERQMPLRMQAESWKLRQLFPKIGGAVWGIGLWFWDPACHIFRKLSIRWKQWGTSIIPEFWGWNRKDISSSLTRAA